MTDFKKKKAPFSEESFLKLLYTKTPYLTKLKQMPFIIKSLISHLSEGQCELNTYEFINFSSESPLLLEHIQFIFCGAYLFIENLYKDN
jgi:hypothetical protein